MGANTPAPEWLEQYRATVANIDLDRDIIGLEPQREAIRSVLARLRYADRLADIGGRLVGGVLLHGPSGCGKTLAARAIASAVSAFADVEMFAVPGGVLTAKRWSDLGTWITRRDHDRLLILYIDEIDALGRISPTGIRSEALTSALAAIDGFEQAGRDRVVWIAASNTPPERLDRALTRRLELWIAFDAPDRYERAALARFYARQVPQGEIDWRRAGRLMGSVSSAKVIHYTLDAIARALAESSAESRDSAQLEWRHVEAAIRAGGRVERKPRADPEVIAVHEAGHVVVGRALGLPFAVAMILESEGETAFGDTRDDDAEPWLTVEQTRAVIAMSYAGILAEEQVLGRAVLGASADVWEVQRRLDGLAASARLPGYPPLPPGSHRPERGFDQPYFTACAAVADEEHERARQILIEREEEVRAVAAAIQARGHLTIEDLPAVLESLAV